MEQVAINSPDRGRISVAISSKLIHQHPREGILSPAFKMKINLADYLQHVTEKEIDEFEYYIKHPTEKPSEEKFQKLMTKLKKKIKADGKR